MRAKKSYGQHFLTNEIIAASIAGSLTSPPGCTNVLEIGPGKGMLTRHLMKLPVSLKAVEADDDMVEYLYTRFPDFSTQIIRQDFLKLDLKQVFDGDPFAIIGNFPYNISSQILFKMLEYKEYIPELVGMFQKEVALRICSEPKSKVYGVVSVLVQAYYHTEYLFEVDKSNFTPSPKVQSAVIRLVRKESLDLECNPKLFKTIVKQAFSQRRKMLRNTMKTFIKGHELLTDDFFQLRPEQLSVQDFIWLTQQIAKIKGEH